MTFASSELPFHYFDTISGSVGCRVAGGNPRPNITVSVGSAVSIPQSIVQVSRMWSGSVSGFMKPSWLVLSYTEHFRVLPDYDGEDIVCTASIYDYNFSSSNIILVTGNQIMILMLRNFLGQSLFDHGWFWFWISFKVQLWPAWKWMLKTNRSHFQLNVLLEVGSVSIWMHFCGLD